MSDQKKLQAMYEALRSSPTLSPEEIETAWETYRGMYDGSSDDSDALVNAVWSIWNTVHHKFPNHELSEIGEMLKPILHKKWKEQPSQTFIIIYSIPHGFADSKGEYHRISVGSDTVLLLRFEEVNAANADVAKQLAKPRKAERVIGIHSK